MRTMTRAVRIGFAALLLSLSGAVGAGAARQDATTEITFWTTSEEGYPEWEAAFERANPNVVVTTEYIGDYDEMAQKVQAAIAGDATPNVAQMGQRRGLPQVIDAGVLVPAEEYLSAADIADVREGL